MQDPQAVRYAWADNPECNLINAEGLPTIPFRTDNWREITQKLSTYNNRLTILFTA
ncbi:hypothetical protein ACTJKN_04215 [Pedobacter sp. 22163]|uniref:hypothetical protein n=1 Tax=Pedobacter sp. 22163 TaxID=3453883 RepID=UPI003F83EF05